MVDIENVPSMFREVSDGLSEEFLCAFTDRHLRVDEPQMSPRINLMTSIQCEFT
jgi:hypothetical protein